ncbi:hypothetical protein OAN24_03875 [Pseudodesulfovibrio sp.]|nr:hypothetical protein [Pseudodesulfovibrio sp.]
MPTVETLIILWDGLLWPLIWLCFFISVGLLVGELIESLNWTRYAAKLAGPLARRGHLKDVSAASFSVAFFSSISANTMLSKAYEKGTLSNRELIISNLFNSLPTFLLHLPSIFFIAAPFIGSAAAIYVGLTALAAGLRTGAIIIIGKFLLPPQNEGCLPCRLDELDDRRDLKSITNKALQRFKKRLPKMLYLTCPIYAFFFALKQIGVFDWLESYMADSVSFFSFLPPESITIVIFHMTAEFTAGLAAAGALMSDTGLSASHIVGALMLGNLLSTPIKALRRQLPYYAGIFGYSMALRLVAYNQLSRGISIAIVGGAYFVFCQTFIF